MRDGCGRQVAQGVFAPGQQARFSPISTIHTFPSFFLFFVLCENYDTAACVHTRKKKILKTKFEKQENKGKFRSNLSRYSKCIVWKIKQIFGKQIFKDMCCGGAP